MPIIFSAHDEDEEEEVRLRRRVQLYAEERPPVVGELQITTKCAALPERTRWHEAHIAGCFCRLLAQLWLRLRLMLLLLRAH